VVTWNGQIKSAMAEPEVRLGTIIYAALYSASNLTMVEGGRRVRRALNVFDVNRIKTQNWRIK
jgi:hypothetical protein